MNYIEIDGGEELKKAELLLAGIPGGVYKASYAAMSRAGSSAKTKAGQLASAEYTITKGTFMGKTVVRSHGHGAASISIRFAGSVLPLLQFQTRYASNGLMTRVRRDGGGGALQHAFVANVFGSTAVFERSGKGRFPVEQLFGPATGSMMKDKAVVEKMEQTIIETYEKRMEHEITRILNGWGGKK